MFCEACDISHFQVLCFCFEILKGVCVIVSFLYTNMLWFSFTQVGL